jgi:hypothetical protein
MTSRGGGGHGHLTTKQIQRDALVKWEWRFMSRELLIKCSTLFIVSTSSSSLLIVVGRKIEFC